MSVSDSQNLVLSLCSLEHQGQKRIGIFFPYDDEVIRKVRKLSERWYCPLRRCWHIPFGAASLEELQALGIPYQTDDVFIQSLLHATRGTSPTSGTSGTATPLRDHTGTPSALPQQEQAVAADIFFSSDEKLKVQFSNQHFCFFFSYHPAIVKELKGLKRCWWHKPKGCWIAYGSIANLSAIQVAFDLWSEAEYRRLEEMIQLYEHPRKMTLYRLPESKTKVAIQFEGYGIDHAFIKSIPFRSYDKAFKRWIVEADSRLIDRIIAHYEDKGVEVINRLPGHAPVQQKQAYSLAERQVYLLSKYAEADRPLVKQVSDKLIQMRYSWKTVTAYVNPLVKLSHWLGDSPISTCSTRQVNAYLAELSGQKVSESLVHRHVSALKFYFEKVVLNPDIQLQQIKRPKKSFHLPRILSRGEVARMIRLTDNLKHRTILYSLYASGLRLSELLHLRLDDIQWDRGQIFIQGGKGKKDRVVMLSEVLKKVLQQYCDAYKPVYWLLESRKAGQPYSASSIQSVVRQAAKRAQITQRVTPHSLRHCFATHLHDGGVSIKLIQELLGHAHVETTMIYTHVSTESVISVKSPLDDLTIDEKTQ